MFALMILAMGAGATPQSFDPGNVVRCIRESVIGTLIGTRRVCHTVREWRDIQDRVNDEARRIIRPGDPNGGSGGDSPTSFGAGKSG